MQHIEHFSIRGHYSPEWNSFPLWIVTETPDHKVAVVRLQEEIETFDKGLIVEPTVQLTLPQAQQLCDILFKAGFHPRDGTGGTAQVEALRDHLQDMRRAYEVLLERFARGKG